MQNDIKIVMNDPLTTVTLLPLSFAEVSGFRCYRRTSPPIFDLTFQPSPNLELQVLMIIGVEGMQNALSYTESGNELVD